MASFVERSVTTAKTHPDYDLVAQELKKVRVCMLGSQAVKRETYWLLPHPSQADTNSKSAVARYLEYLAGAEYTNDAEKTKRTLIGKMRLDDSTINVPDRLAYLKQDVDGDGMSMIDGITHSLAEAMAMKFHVLVADYRGLSDVELDAVTIADINTLNPRANIKQYSRDSIINWHFSRTNGRMQLSYIELRELGTNFDPGTGAHKPLESYLILALDENGDYYQQKKVYGSDTLEGERMYVEVAGQRLKWLPIQFVADEPMPSGALPIDLGFLYPICEASLHAYRVSAVYKETQKATSPTLLTKGWDDAGFDLFKKMNGRDFFAIGGGAVNNVPENVSAEYISANNEMSDFQWYFEQAQKRIAKLGGFNESADVSMTATEASLVASEQNALLQTLAASAENAWRRIISYCAMFEGVVAPDMVEDDMDDIIVELPRDFAKPKLSVEEVRALMEMTDKGRISEDEFMRQVKNGGWLMAEIEAMKVELDNQAPRLNLQPLDSGL